MSVGPDARARALLVVGALTGVVLAGAGLLRSDPGVDEVGGDVLARVEGRPIFRTDVERGLTAIDADRREGVRVEDRARVLDRLIDEELLVQRALELGLAERDRRVRDDLVSAMIDALTARAGDDAEPEPGELAAFYAAEADYFRRPSRFEVEHVFLRDGDGALDRAESAREALLAGQSIASMATDRPALPLRAGWVSPRDLTAALGPTAAERVARLREGEVSEPLATAEGYHVVRVVARRGGEVPPLAESRDAVVAEYRRRAGERALRDFLDERRAAARVTLAEGE